MRMNLKEASPSGFDRTKRLSTAEIRATHLIHQICTLSASPAFLDELLSEVDRDKILVAVARHDTPAIFDWLMTSFSYQGISDSVACSYMRKHGNVSWRDIQTGLKRQPTCFKLRDYWSFANCRYDKGSHTCSEPEHIECCPLPGHPLRNGRLNQTAYSLFLFLRNIAKSDLVSWLDQRLDTTQGPDGMSEAQFAAQRQERLLGPLRQIYGLSDKVLTMTLSTLLIGCSETRPHWFGAGIEMMAIDTLVHNFLHRTGIVQDCGQPHAYGARCYAPGGCADIVRMAATHIDARAFNPTFPKRFPRFVQHALWRYCAADGLDICNGNRIDDRKSCEISFCQIFEKCSKIALKTQHFQ